MNVLLMPNLQKNDSVPCTNRAIEQLNRHGATAMLDESFRTYIESPEHCAFGRFDELLHRCDCLLAIGGDGTILRAVKQALEVDKPVLGINTGRIGFLTQMEGSELEHLGQLAGGNYRVEKRMLLELEPIDSSGPILALNDIVIKRDNHKITETGVYCDGNLVVQHMSDGLIIATPTGSTGYTLSAGGSVVYPTLELISLTAISPYSAYNRSLVLPPDQIYTVRHEGEGSFDILADGEVVGTMQPGDELQIRRSLRHARLIQLDMRDFYGSLREKLIMRR